MESFDELVNKATMTEPILPLCHTCDVYTFRSILKGGLLDVSQCEHFNERLLYFFYGKPAYRLSEDSVTSNLQFCPVTIAIKLNKSQDIKRIAPFDTGAFFKKKYSQHMHPKMSCDDFLLPPTFDIPSRIVTQFFGSNVNYCEGMPNKKPIDPLNLEAESYQNIIHDQAIRECDDRGHTIEVQTSKPFSLGKSNVLFVMLPKVLLDHDDICDILLNRWGVKPIGYTSHSGRSSEYIGLIYKEFMTYLKKNGYL